MVKKIYEEIYKISNNNRKEFLDNCNKKKLKYSSSLRRWYDLVESNKTSIIKEIKKEEPKTIKEEKFKRYPNEPRIQPSNHKMLIIKDMKRLGFEITKVYLKQHRFSDAELNWLDDNGYFEEY